MPAAPASRRPDRLPIVAAARAVTAIVGGYGFAGGLAALVARLLPVARVEAATWGLLLSFPLFASILLWAYAERRLARVLIVIWGGTAASAVLLLLLGVRP